MAMPAPRNTGLNFFFMNAHLFTPGTVDEMKRLTLFLQ
jgi:hypothetical protein